MKILIFSFLFISCSILSSSQVIHHQLDTKIEINKHQLSVVDHITFPAKYLLSHPDLVFTLNKNLAVKTIDEKVIVKEITDKNTENNKENIRTYRVRAPHRGNKEMTIGLAYSGEIYDKVATGPTEYARGFSETTGIIHEDGVYLSGATHWVPKFKDSDLFSFVIDAMIDKDWTIVSQGTRTINEIKEGLQHIRYEVFNPMDEAYLMGGKWTEYDLPSDHVLFQAFLRTPDENLANKYLKATQGYLAMDEQMIGPYPFSKFALVENFWETGYGMPSFTLLGPKVIRFPWILYSSYPHELLHNYWGNSVYVDFKTGNWCEGITAYMADHLMKEQQGQGSEYRRNTLQKYTDFVNPGNDFPLVQFINRNNPAQEAIGYGKCLMMNNMLRLMYGDQNFLAAYRKFYKDFRFKIAGFDDIQKCFEEITGEDLSMFFKQWTQKKGAPKLTLSDVNSTYNGSSYNVRFKIHQTQTEDVFDLEIPVAVYNNEMDHAIISKVHMDRRSQEYLLVFDQRPLRIDIDPTFQVFRRLDRMEVPTSLTQLFGAKKSVVILPSKSPFLSAYRKMGQTWKASQEAQHKTLSIYLDNEIDKLPAHSSIWVLGDANKFASLCLLSNKYMGSLAPKEQELFAKLRKDGSLVYTLPHPLDENYTLGFIGTTVADAVEGLTRKLPHYGKYSYLGFEGKEPTNILEGSFPALGSPLNFMIPYNGKTFPVKARIIPRKALSENDQ